MSDKTQVSAKAYETLLVQMMEIGLLVASFPVAIVLAGVESVQKACDDAAKGEGDFADPDIAAQMKQECEGLRQHKLTLQHEIGFALKVAQIGVQNARDKYLAVVKEHPEWQQKSGVVVKPKGAGKIWMPGE